MEPKSLEIAAWRMLSVDMAHPGFNRTPYCEFSGHQDFDMDFFSPLEANVCSNWYPIYLKKYLKDTNQYKQQKVNVTW